MKSEFVCLDGEGMDSLRDIRTHHTTHVNPLTHEKQIDVYTSQEHLYTFLASSTGRYIRNWQDGLSTADCFEFILSEKKEHTILTGFSFGYDACMLWRDVEIESLKILWEQGKTYTYQNGKLYKIDYLAGKWLSISHIERDEKGKMHVKRSAKVWDVFGFFQHSFVKSLDEWLSNDNLTQSVLDSISRMKEKRGQFTAETAEETEAYCLEECRLLKELMNKLRDTLERANIYLKSWHGAGAISGYLFNQHYIDRHVHWDDMPELAQEASLWSYFGGRIELFQQGFIEPPIYNHDIIGSYPSDIVNLPSLRRGIWYGCGGGEINVKNPLCKYGMWYLSWDTRTHHLEWLSPYPQRNKDGTIVWSTTGEGWYHGPEVIEALRIFGNRITIEKGVYFIPYDWDEKPFSWLAEVMRLRLEYKHNGDPRHIILKLGGNSGYGKLAQGTSNRAVFNSRPRYQNYYLAGLITASCRAKMLAAISEFSREDVISAVTDGIYTRTLCDRIKSSPGVLGSWEIGEVKHEPGFFGQAGVTFYPSGKEIKSRGFRKTSIDYNTVCDAWKRACGDWAVFSVEYRERRFNGLGYCASTGRWEEFRRWVDRKREFTLRTEPRKYHDDGNNETNAFLLSPGDPPEKRVAYTPKQPGMSIGEDEMLELLDLIEQPEYPG